MLPCDAVSKRRVLLDEENLAGMFDALQPIAQLDVGLRLTSV